MENKKEKPVILVCTDGPTVSTGFGRVCYNLVTRWLATGKYKIVVMATNDRADYHPLRGTPDLVIEPLPYITEDPYGLHKLPEILRRYDPDIIFSLNDIWVWTGDERHQELDDWFMRRMKEFKPYIPWIGYFPVDGRLWDQKWVNLVNNMTYAVVFSDYGYKVMKETPNVNMDKIRVIYHGHDTQNFFPLPDEDKLKIKHMLNVPGKLEDSFIVGCINRNQPRKNIPSLIYAFKMFKDGFVYCDNCGYPRNLDVMADCELCGSFGYKEGKKGVGDSAYLYLHMNPIDLRGYRLPKIVRDNKLANVIMNPQFDVAAGVPIEMLNGIYNACDVIVNPTSAGGYELTVAEALAAGRPVIGTRTTSVTEQLEDNRGYLVRPCTAMIYEDAAHTPKHVIDTKELVETLFYVYENREDAMVRGFNGIEFSKERNWDKSAKQFEELIDKALDTRVHVSKYIDTNKNNKLIINDTNNFGHILAMIPYMKKLAENDKNNNYIYSLNNRMLQLFLNIKDLNVIPFDKTWLSNREMPETKLEIHNIDGVINRFESAYKFVQNTEIPSWPDIYSKIFSGLSLSLDEITDCFKLRDEEIDFSNGIILEEDKEKFKVCFVMDTDNLNYGIPSEIFAQTVKFLNKFDDVVTYGISNNNVLDAVNTKYKISDITLREIFAILTKMNCIVTNVEEYVYLANIINVPFVVIQGPKDLKNVAKYARAVNKKNNKQLISFVDSKTKYGCMPCHKGDTQKCMVWESPKAHCMLNISAGAIFARIINNRDAFKSS